MLYVKCAECGKIISSRVLVSNHFTTKDLCKSCRDRQKNKR